MSRSLMELLNKIFPCACLWSAGSQPDTFSFWYYLFTSSPFQAIYSPYNYSINLWPFPPYKINISMLCHMKHFTEIQVDGAYLLPFFFFPHKKIILLKNALIFVCHNSPFQTCAALSHSFCIPLCIIFFFKVFSLIIPSWHHEIVKFIFRLLSLKFQFYLTFITSVAFLCSFQQSLVL